jgi:hypothetical protein
MSSKVLRICCILKYMLCNGFITFIAPHTILNIVASITPTIEELIFSVLKND